MLFVSIFGKFDNMCVAPLKILNRSKVQIAGLTPDHYTVPCGKCWQCQQARRDGFTVRSIFEWLQAESNKGFTLFLTLTYSNDYLHTYCGVPLFNKDDVQKYLKIVRITLYRKLLNKYDSQTAKSIVNGNVRYFVSSENGDKFHRPHYHILFFVNSPYINKWFFRNLAINAWHHGFAVPSKENYGFVTDVRGIKYVAKYVGKSMIDNEYFANCIRKYKKVVDDCKSQIINLSLLKKQYLSESSSDLRNIGSLHEQILSVSKTQQFNQSIVDKLEQNKPFLLCSKGLGRFALSEDCPKDYRLTNEMFLNGKIFCPDNQGTIRSYILPDYFRRKTFYNVSSEKISKRHVMYRLNEFGIDVKSKAFQKYFDNYEQNIKDLLSMPVPNSILQNQYVKDMGISSVGQLHRYISIEALSPATSYEFKEFALLYSNYTQFMEDRDLRLDSSPSPYDVYSFRLFVGSDTETSIDLDSLSGYFDFYLDVCSRIHNLVVKHPLFPRVLNLLEIWQSSIFEYLTEQQRIKDKIFSDNKQLKLFSA